MHDTKLVKWVIVILLALPVTLLILSKDTFRYPCQNPENWDTPQCQKPLCDVTRTCPEHVFKGQRDPRLGPPPETTPQIPQKGAVNCGK